jgi:exopolysaccharide biosynthesis polyprenyl glycosylphosphotransferase
MHVHSMKKTINSKAWGYKVIGIVINDDDAPKQKPVNINILGYVSEIKQILEEYNPEELIITKDHQNTKELYDIVTLADDMGIRVKVEPDLYDIFTGQAKVQMLYGIPLIEIKSQIIKRYQEIFKRAFDIVFSLLVLIIGMPLWLLVALLIKIDSKGKILFTQYRVGRFGKEFKMYKFRSMKQGSEKEKKATAVGDPRVTKFGRFIRKTHLDEIPQFYNVLIGDMSVVGPRPEIKYNVDKFAEALPQYKRRHKVRPGITGWWQVNYGPHVLDLAEIENRLKDDFYYMENYSLTLDVEIVARTVWCVFKGHGQA